MENHDTTKLSYDEACKILKYVINVNFPAQEKITHNFIKENLYTSLPIDNLETETKSALCCLLNQASFNLQSVEKKQDNTSILTNKTSLQSLSKQTTSHKRQEIAILSKNQRPTSIEEKNTPIKNITQPIIKKEKVTISPDSKIWEDNIRVIKGIEFSDQDRKTALNSINHIIKKYLSKEAYVLFLTQYTKVNSQNINFIIEKYKSIEKYIEFLANNDNKNTEQEFIIYRIQSIRMDILSKNYNKNLFQKIIINIEKELNI